MTGISGLVRVNLASLFAQIVQVGGFPVLLAFSLDALEQSEAVIGMVVTLPWLAVLVGAGFLPRIIRRTNERWAALLGIFMSIAALGLLFLSVSLLTLVFSALLMGAGLILRWVACDTWILRLVPPAARGRAIGVHETLMGLGIAAGPAVLLLRDHLTLEPTAAFLVLLVLSLLVLSLSPLGQETAEEEMTNSGSKGKTLYFMLALVLCAAALSGFAETSSVALLPLWFMQQDVTEQLALALLVSFGLGGTVLQLPIGAIADRFSVATAEYLCAACLVVGCLANLLLLEAPLLVSYASLFLWGGAVGGLNTLAVIEAGARTHGEDTSRAMAAIASAYTLGGVIGPAFLGVIWSVWGSSAMMLSLASLGGIYLIFRAIPSRSKGKGAP